MRNAPDMLMLISALQWAARTLKSDPCTPCLLSQMHPAVHHEQAMPPRYSIQLQMRVCLTPCCHLALSSYWSHNSAN